MFAQTRQELQVFQFDRVVNDLTEKGIAQGGTVRLYNTVLRPKIVSGVGKGQGISVLMFGPHNSQHKTRKESPLLSESLDYNMALRCLQDI